MRRSARGQTPLVPFEQSSPLGPAFQPARWDDPVAFAGSARSCQADCDSVGECDAPEKALTAVAILAPLGLLAPAGQGCVTRRSCEDRLVTHPLAPRTY